MTAFGNDSLNTRRTLIAAGKSFDYFSLRYGKTRRMRISKSDYFKEYTEHGI